MLSEGPTDDTNESANEPEEKCSINFVKAKTFFVKSKALYF